MAKHLSVGIVATALLIPSAGCIPDVAWLPDSSGIIFTDSNWPGGPPEIPIEKNGRLVHYDLATKISRQIAVTETKTIRPGLSADGKRIAVAVVGEKAGASTLQVVVYDLQGKVVQRSKGFEWGTVAQGDILHPHLFWALSGNKLLVHANKQSGICDLDNDRAILLGTGLPSLFGVSPIRPDGKGFLITRDNSQILFVDWDGKESLIKIPVDKPLERLEALFPVPAAICWSRWEGNVAVATWKRGQLRIDTKQLVGVWHPLDNNEWAADGKEIQDLFSFPDGKTKVVSVYLMGPRDFKDAGLPTVRVYLVGPKPNQRRLLVEKTPHCGIYPSPDKKQVALRFMDIEARPPRDNILVVNQNGEIAATIDPWK